MDSYETVENTMLKLLAGDETMQGWTLEEQKNQIYNFNERCRHGYAKIWKGQASIPYGGSKKFALRMMERYLALGGTIEASCEAVELNIDRSKVQSVICNNGKTFNNNEL